MKDSRPDRATLFSSAACVVLFALCLAIIETDIDDVPPPLPESLPAPAPGDAPAPASSVQSYSSIWLKPLFWASRSADPVATGVAAQASGLTLTGVVITPALRIALFKQADNKTVTGKPGQPLPNGWQLIRVEPRTVELARDTERLTLALPVILATPPPPKDPGAALQ